MKIKFLLITLLISFFGFAQFTVAKSDGTPINDGDIYTFGTTTYPDNSIEFVVTNPTAQDMDVVINVVSITNTDGSGMEICFGLCYSGITAHTFYPTDTPYHLTAGSSSEPNGNHILNSITNGALVLEYVLKFTQVDVNGVEFGTPVTITYRYDPSTASVSSESLIDYNLFPTIVKDNKLTIVSNNNLEVTIINLQGKTVKQSVITPNNQNIDLSNLKANVYFVLVADDKGNEDYKKIIIQ